MKKTFKKRAFISAIAMLVVSAIVLTSATFAWFSMARTVQVESMELNVTSPEGVQISANTTNFTTALTVDELNTDPAGTPISRFAADTDHTNHFPNELAPSSSTFTSTATAFPQFYTANMDQNSRLTARAVTDATGGYVVFDVYLKVAVAQTIYWNQTKVETEPVTNGGNPEVLDSMRVAIVDCGGSTTAATAKTITSADTAANPTQMLEVNAKDHLDSLAGKTINGTVVTDGTSITTRYLRAPFSNVNAADTGTLMTSSTYAVASTARVQATEDTTSDLKFDLVEGINRIRVYLWMEGNDIDCLSEVAGSQLTFNLVFSLDAA